MAPNFELRVGSTKLSNSEAQGLVEKPRLDLRLTPLAQLLKDLTGKPLWFFHDVLAVPLEQCWAPVRPDSTSTGRKRPSRRQNRRAKSPAE